MEIGQPAPLAQTDSERDAVLRAHKRGLEDADRRARVQRVRSEVDAAENERLGMGPTVWADKRTGRNDPVWDVDLFSTAWRTIESEVWASTDGRETGGVLLGRRNLPDPADRKPRQVMIYLAGGPGPKATRADDYLIPDHAYGDALARQHSLEVVGFWHSHPNGETDLSAGDLKAITRQMSRLERQYGKRNRGGKYSTFTEIIVAPGAGVNFLDPDVSAYVFTSRDVHAAIWPDARSRDTKSGASMWDAPVCERGIVRGFRVPVPA